MTLAGTPNYLTIAAQVITQGLVNLAAHVTGDLPLTNFAQASAATRLLCRGQGAGAGDWQECTIGSGLSMSGTTMTSTGGGGGGAPTTSLYVALATDATLDNERVLTAGSGISITDGGAGSTVTITATGGSASDASLDLSAMRAAFSGLAVYSGLAVTEDDAGAGLDVDVAAGHIRLATGAGLLVTAPEVTLDAAHASLLRIDIVSVNTSGALGRTTGTAAATPLAPVLPANSVLLASVTRAATDDTVVNVDITDKRTYTRLPQTIRKATSETVNNSSAMQNDDELKFTGAANQVWTYMCSLSHTGNSNTRTFRSRGRFPQGRPDG